MSEFKVGDWVVPESNKVNSYRYVREVLEVDGDHFLVQCSGSFRAYWRDFKGWRKATPAEEKAGHRIDEPLAVVENSTQNAVSPTVVTGVGVVKDNVREAFEKWHYKEFFYIHALCNGFARKEDGQYHSSMVQAHFESYVARQAEVDESWQLANQATKVLEQSMQNTNNAIKQSDELYQIAQQQKKRIDAALAHIGRFWDEGGLEALKDAEKALGVGFENT